MRIEGKSMLMEIKKFNNVEPSGNLLGVIKDSNASLVFILKSG